MTQSPQDPSWLPWLGALVPAAAAIGAFMRRFFNTVSRAELREAIQDSNRIIDQRHAETHARLARQDEELKEIRQDAAATRAIAARLEGLATTGKFPRIER